jgi:hypothetical protein
MSPNRQCPTRHPYAPITDRPFITYHAQPRTRDLNESTSPPQHLSASTLASFTSLIFIKYPLYANASKSCRAGLYLAPARLCRLPTTERVDPCSKCLIPVTTSMNRIRVAITNCRECTLQGYLTGWDGLAKGVEHVYELDREPGLLLPVSIMSLRGSNYIWKELNLSTPLRLQGHPRLLCHYPSIAQLGADNVPLPLPNISLRIQL